MRSVEVTLVFMAPDGTDGSVVSQELESMVLEAMGRQGMTRRLALDGLAFVMSRAEDVPLMVPPALWQVGDAVRCCVYGSDREVRAKVWRVGSGGLPESFVDAQGTILMTKDLVHYARV